MENKTKKRTWSIQTSRTRSIGVRIPNEDYERLERFMKEHDLTISKAVCLALSYYLDFAMEGEDEF